MSKKDKSLQLKNNQNTKIEVREERLKATTRSGPIPDSDEMAKYENIQAGFANRILIMAEENGKHRREMEKLSLLSDSENKKNIIENDKISIKSFSAGRWLGTFISLVAIGGAIYLGVTGGSQVIAVALVALPVASIIQAVIGQSTKDKNK